MKTEGIDFGVQFELHCADRLEVETAATQPACASYNAIVLFIQKVCEIWVVKPRIYPGW